MSRKYLVPALALLGGVILGSGGSRILADTAPKPLLGKSGVLKIPQALEKHSMPEGHAKPVYLVPIGDVPGGGVGFVFARGELAMHKHEKRSEVVYVLEGQGKFTIGEVTFDLEPGDLMLIPKGTPHGGSFEGELKTLISHFGEVDPDDFVPVK